MQLRLSFIASNQKFYKILNFSPHSVVQFAMKLFLGLFLSWKQTVYNFLLAPWYAMRNSHKFKNIIALET